MVHRNKLGLQVALVYTILKVNQISYNGYNILRKLTNNKIKLLEQIELKHQHRSQLLVVL